MIQMTKFKQTEEDFKNQLKDQIQLLLNACQSFDNGFKMEAKNIAIRLRILLWDKGRSTSLLTHLGKKNILFYDSTHDEGLLTPFMSFIGIRTTSEGIEYIPNLDSVPQLISNKKINFEEWWNQEILKGPFTREDVVRAVCNKDGGAHVDLNLDGEYADLTRKNSIGIVYYNGDVEKTPKGIELAVIRQIAYEVIRSLKDEFPEFFQDDI